MIENKKNEYLDKDGKLTNKSKNIAGSFALIAVISYVSGLSIVGKIGLSIWWVILLVLAYNLPHNGITSLKDLLFIWATLYWLWHGYIRIRHKEWLWLRGRKIYESK